ncbi:MAG: hypothetical protein Q7T05_02715, partial [Dehalococcoidia bacterium]|nr:hypothetical protein [Dehalococcoidia bacterium]
ICKLCLYTYELFFLQTFLIFWRSALAVSARGYICFLEYGICEQRDFQVKEQRQGWFLPQTQGNPAEGWWSASHTVF